MIAATSFLDWFYAVGFGVLYFGFLIWLGGAISRARKRRRCEKC